jgi:hypothetical protein
LAFGLAALALGVAAVATDMLPTRCGVVGRPNVDTLAVVALGFGGLLWLGASITALTVKTRDHSRRPLLATAIVEFGPLFAVLVFYLHQTGGPYPNCG